jgi:peroxiredoxin
VAQILFMKATLYLQVFDNTEKGVELVNQLKRDFPATKPGQNAETMLASIEKQAEGKKIQRALAVGTKFPDFTEKDVAGKPLSLANYKGKVVLIDFWATWCGPCVAELPNVLETYKKHHPGGFEIVGISLDEDQTKLETFTRQKSMTWQQFFDGQGWKNKLAQKYGVNSIPATYLLDGDGKIIAKDLRGEALEKAVAQALAKK